MLIAGTGGLGKEIMGFLIDDGVPASEITFFDESQNGEEKLFGQFRIIRSGDELKDFLTSQPEFIVGIGHPRIREEVVLRIEKAGGKLVSAISAKAHIFHYNEKPEGIIIQPGVGISHNAKFGRGCAIHINSTIGHSAKIGKFVNVGPNVSVIGPISIGDYSYIAAQSVLLPGLKIGRNVVVSAGSLVNRDMADYESFPG